MPNVLALKITREEATRLMTWVINWRTTVLQDPCHSLTVTAPFAKSGDKSKAKSKQDEAMYIQMRGTVINEHPRNPNNSLGNYAAPPATGAPRMAMLLDPEGRPGIGNNTKFILQQLVAYAMYKDPAVDVFARVEFTAYFEAEGWKTNEISHLCSNKLCTEITHLFPESSEYNKSRHGCPVLIFINGEPYPHCDHNPPCKASLKALEKAKRYTVTQEDLDRQGTPQTTTTTTTTTTTSSTDA